MLKITDDAAHNALVLEPSGALTRGDFEEAARRFDARAAAGEAPNLVIHAKGFPGWADFGAMTEHFRFVRAHEDRVAKIALVSDSAVLEIGPRIARQFMSAEVRRFPADEMAAALTWVAKHEPAAPSVTLIEGLPDDVVGISVGGTVRARDYAETIEPLIEAKLKTHDRIKCLYRIGPEFESFTAGAAWSDARLGLTHLTSFRKIALVTDVGWIAQATRLFAPMIPGEVQVFADAELADAKAWIAA